MQSHRLSKKSIDLLVMAGHHADTELWQVHYDRACTRYSDKAVYKKMEELASRGYVEYGVSARTAWLTEKGQEALVAAWREERAGNHWPAQGDEKSASC